MTEAGAGAEAGTGAEAGGGTGVVRFRVGAEAGVGEGAAVCVVASDGASDVRASGVD